MAELTIQTPSEKQQMFLSARHKYVGYGGARGGGKSWAMRTKCMMLAITALSIGMIALQMLIFSVVLEEQAKQVLQEFLLNL